MCFCLCVVKDDGVKMIHVLLIMSSTRHKFWPQSRLKKEFKSTEFMKELKIHSRLEIEPRPSMYL